MEDHTWKKDTDINLDCNVKVKDEHEPYVHNNVQEDISEDFEDIIPKAVVYNTQESNNIDDNIKDSSKLNHLHYDPKYNTCSVAIKTESVKVESVIYDVNQTITDVHTNCAVYNTDNSIDIDIKDEPLRIKTESAETDIQQGLCNKTVAVAAVSQDANYVLKIKNKSNLRTLCECNVCHKKFTQSSKLRRHMRAHTNKKPHECDICHKRFSENSNLLSHMRIHSGEKPHECDICHKQFNCKSNLNVHTRKHTGEKPYECDICHKRFSSNRIVIAHRGTHTEEKSFKCHICHKQFYRIGHLNVHMRIHTGEKPFECIICHKQFSLNGHLKGHVRTHTGEMPYECDICHKRFYNNSKLTSHLRMHANESVLSIKPKRS